VEVLDLCLGNCAQAGVPVPLEAEAGAEDNLKFEDLKFQMGRAQSARWAFRASGHVGVLWRRSRETKNEMAR